MRKKYLSALLFGALLVASTGTFTSCKDYDDDINNLQEQIDAQKSLSEKLAAAETAITELQKADTELQAKIDAATDAAEKAALEAQQNAIAEAAKQLEAVKTELTALINGQTEATNEAIEDINAKIAEIQGAVQALEKLNGEIEALKNADATLNASITDLEAKVADNARLIGELQTALKTQEEALNNFKEATGTDIADINSDIKALQDKIAEIIGNDDMTSITEQLKDLEEEFDTLSTKVDGISTSLNTLKYAWYEGITGVSLIISSTNGDYNAENLRLLSEKAVVSYEFGKQELDANLFTSPIAGAEMATFKDGERTKLEAKFLMRVFPVTATPKASDIKIINSLGVDLIEAGQIKVKGEPVKYNDLLTRSNGETGLWTVTLEVADGFDEVEFDKLTTKEVSGKLEYPLFAVGIVDNKTAVEEGKAPRMVVSEYNLTFDNKVDAPKDELGFHVTTEFSGNKYIKDIYNRGSRSNIVEEVTFDQSEWKDYTWKNGAQSEIITDGSLVNVINGQDDRSDKNMIEAEVGQPIEVQLCNDDCRWPDENMLNSVVYYYIVLDKTHATASDESEITAWNSYEANISGINQMYSVAETNGKATITINQNINDIVGFRVYAVNANGTLVDPDGRSFYVKVGKTVNNVSSAAATIYPVVNIGDAHAHVFATFDAQLATIKDALKTNETYTIVESNVDQVYRWQDYDVNGYVNGSALGNAFGISFAKVDGTPVNITINNGFSKEDFKDVAAVFAAPNSSIYGNDWRNYIDGIAYNASYAIKDSKGNVVARLNVSMTKEVPTSIPEGFDWKAKQLTDGSYACYLMPTDMSATSVDWTQWNAEAATNGYLRLADIFEDSEYDNDSRYNYTFGDNSTAGYKTTTGTLSQHLIFDKSVIDDGNTYDVTVAYNYGKVSSRTPELDIVREMKNKVTYSCIYNANSYNWVWNSDAYKDTEAPKETLEFIQNGKLVYADNLTARVEFKLESGARLNIAELIKGTSTYDGWYDATLAKPYPVSKNDALNQKYFSSLRIVDAYLYTKGTNKEEYFTVVWEDDNNDIFGFRPISFNSNPTEPVASELVVNFVDMYGHKHTFTKDITIVRR